MRDWVIAPEDAIVHGVVDVNKIEEVMLSAYKHFGLHPTFSVDTYQQHLI